MTMWLPGLVVFLLLIIINKWYQKHEKIQKFFLLRILGVKYMYYDIEHRKKQICRQILVPDGKDDLKLDENWMRRSIDLLKRNLK